MTHSDTTETYYQCPYCEPHISVHGKRTPKSVGKYRVKIIYRNVLIFTCSKCSRRFRIEINPNICLWDNLTPKQKTDFKKIHNNSCKEVKE